MTTLYFLTQLSCSVILSGLLQIESVGDITLNILEIKIDCRIAIYV